MNDSTPTQPNNSKPVILELVGPAGAGKTTLRNTLLQRFPEARLRNYPYFRNWKASPFFLINTLRMLPLLLRIAFHRVGRQLVLKEMVLMVILNGWSPLLKKQAANQHGFTILDQGPVYLLALLDALGPPRLHSPVARAWLDRKYQVWADTIHIIIYLDTTDQALFHRINTRINPEGRQHGVVGRPLWETQAFLERSRKSLNHAIKGLIKRNPRMCIYRFNTSEKSAEAISEEVVSIVNCPL